MSSPRKPGRPATGKKPTRSARVADEEWGPFAAATGDELPRILGQLVAWWARVPGAKMPPRPPVTKPPAEPSKG